MFTLVDQVEESQGVTAPATYRTYADLPNVGGIPGLGAVAKVRDDVFHRDLERWAAELGAPYALRLGATKLVVFTAPADVRSVLLRRPQTFSRFATFQAVFDEMGVGGVFSAEGEQWRRQRRLAMDALAQRNLTAFSLTLERVAQRLLERWCEAAGAGTPLDLREELIAFTVDVTSSLAFARDVNTLQNPEDRIQRHLRFIFPKLATRTKAPFPYWRYLKLPLDRELDRALAALGDWITQLIAETRRKMDAEPKRFESPTNLLEAMLATKDAAGEPFTEKVISGNVLTMLLAGEDTTAHTLAWAVHELLESPAATRRLTEECDAVLGDAPLVTQPAAVARLEYAGAVANEAMRLRPVAPQLFFTALTDTSVGDVWLPKGMNVAVLLRPAVLRPEVVDEPHEFQPERWLEAESVARLEREGGFMPFGFGPRLCPGRNLALLEMRVVLSLLFRNFEVERVGSADQVRERFQFTMIPDGLRVKLRRRVDSGVRRGEKDEKP